MFCVIIYGVTAHSTAYCDLQRSISKKQLQWYCTNKSPYL